jgi:hypothetical protein
MWSRVVEIMLGVWLIISPFIFHHPTSQTSWWINDMAVGTAVILFAVFSYWEPTRLAHVGTLIAGTWLIGFAYYHGFGDAPAASQNHLTLGMLLMMFGLIPSEAEEPPKSWEKRRLTSD